jgi:hypothetical protein
MTRDDMVEMIRLRVGISSADTRMTTYITNMLNQEYQRVAAEAGLFQKVGTLSLVEGSDVVDLPNDWQQTLHITRGGVALIPVVALEFVQLPDDYPTPVFFPQSPERIQIRPIPTANEAQGLKIAYIARPALMTTGTSVPSALPVEYHDLLVELVCIRTYAAEEDAAAMQVTQQQADLLYARLIGHMNKRVSDTGFSITPPPARIR